MQFHENKLDSNLQGQLIYQFLVYSEPFITSKSTLWMQRKCVDTDKDALKKNHMRQRQTNDEDIDMKIIE